MSGDGDGVSLTEPELSRLMVAFERVTNRLDAMENARTLARIDQDEWRQEVRDDLKEIRIQTTATNGRVQALEVWQARLGGVASAFSWWRSALAGIIAVAVGYLIAQ